MSRKKDKWIDYDFGNGKTMRFYTQVSDKQAERVYASMANGPVATFSPAPAVPSAAATPAPKKTKTKAGIL